jgi:hypothetical protein
MELGLPKTAPLSVIGVELTPQEEASLRYPDRWAVNICALSPKPGAITEYAATTRPPHTGRVGEDQAVTDKDATMTDDEIAFRAAINVLATRSKAAGCLRDCRSRRTPPSCMNAPRGILRCWCAGPKARCSRDPLVERTRLDRLRPSAAQAGQ